MSPEIDLENRFASRHIGPRPHDVERMLASMGLASLEELVGQTIPESIRLKTDLDLPEASTEHELLGQLQEIGTLNRVFRSYIGMGYHDTIVPGVILRNILENPGWYTQYTPYQAEISQGRLEALLNYQTVVIDLTGLEIANASLLDEGTAAAEAMTMLFGETKDEARTKFFVSEQCHPQTIDVVRGRAEPLGIELIVGPHDNLDVE
ncbi:MAG: glycine dehydrogenase (aminomethyl-transferring), partial [Gemmatimonadota bacterium]|nr:glycine dehydrogenase (aminomethyl-transferring) [Gemmatimonadota bacterium]